jgi:hypothetical protein
MSVLKIAVLILMGATVVVLLAGLLSMARGGEYDARNSNRLMRLRVLTQGLAIALALTSMVLVATGVLDHS